MIDLTLRGSTLLASLPVQQQLLLKEHYRDKQWKLESLTPGEVIFFEFYYKSRPLIQNRSITA